MIIPVNKPSGYTSHDIVAGLRRAIGGKVKIGHTGTLDPMCTGVLPVLTENYTKLSDIFPSDKAYICKICLGIATDTEDITGEIISKSEVNVSEDEFKAVLSKFIGEIDQVPPMYSSVKKNGVPLYKLARKGVSVEREARRIKIYDIVYNGPLEETDTYSFTVYCSSGTYIRTLCADIGNALGCGACMGALERISSNGITLDRCYDYNDLLILAENGMIDKIAISFESAFAHLDVITIPESGRVYYLNGGIISASRITGVELKPETDYIACAEDGLVLGLAHTDKGRSVKSLWNK
ncbi:MAG: tRNA pseudouridine(55) synthase TruB [Clostridia bacterium]|nr:tRNA pseudouridine(55) synthase TruB [Clostridia bacterium]